MKKNKVFKTPPYWDLNSLDEYRDYFYNSFLSQYKTSGFEPKICVDKLPDGVFPVYEGSYTFLNQKPGNRRFEIISAPTTAKRTAINTIIVEDFSWFGFINKLEQIFNFFYRNEKAIDLVSIRQAIDEISIVDGHKLIYCEIGIAKQN